MTLTPLEALLASLAIGATLFLLRALPFLVFRNRKSPAFFSFLEKYVPAIAIALLFVVCLKEKTTDLIFYSPLPLSELSSVICATVAVIITALLHIWKGNAMISIFSGTILYMILNYFF